MFNIIPITIIIVSLGIILYIIIRKLPHLSNLNVGSLPERKAKEFKTKILDERLRRKLTSAQQAMAPWLKKMKDSVAGGVERAKTKLETFDAEMKKKELAETIENAPTPEVKREAIEHALEQVEQSVEKESFEVSEKKFIDIISQDPKNAEVYLSLAKLYIDNDKKDEAIEIFKYLTKLQPEIAQHSADLADLYFAKGQLDLALAAIKKALAIEAKSPKYLDQIIAIYLARKDKIGAAQYLEIFREVNPENQKLEDLQKEIDKL